MVKTRVTFQKGYTLLEVLVAFFLLSVGMLGLAILQGVGLQGNNKSYLRSIAMVQAYDITDRMRANYPGVLMGSYDSLPVATTVDTSCLSTGCTPAQMAAIDGKQWTDEIALRLPSGTGVVTRLPAASTTAAPIFQVDIGWQETKTSLQQGANAEQTIGCDTLAPGLTCFRLEISP